MKISLLVSLFLSLSLSIVCPPHFRNFVHHILMIYNSHLLAFREESEHIDVRLRLFLVYLSLRINKYQFP